MSPELSRRLEVSRERPYLMVAGIGVALAAATLFLRIPVPTVFLGLVVLAAAAGAVISPEIGLHVLVLNAMVGLTHVVETPRIGPLSAPVLIEAVLVGAILFRATFFRKRIFAGTRQHLLLALLAGWILVSTLTGIVVGPANFQEYRNLFLVRLIVFFLVTSLVTTLDGARRLVVTLTISNVGLLAVAAAVRLGWFGQEKITISQEFERTGALVQNPNELAFALTTMMVLNICCYLYVAKPAVKVLLFVLAAANLFVIMSTLSRSGFISMCVVLLFLLFRLTRNLRAVVVMLALALCGWLMVPAELFARFSQIDEVKDVDRIQIARVGLDMAMAYPMLGVGLGNYETAFPAHNVSNLRRVSPSHNMYLDLAAQMGLPALLLYVSIFAITWRGLRRMESDLEAARATRTFPYLLGLATQAFFVNLAVFGLSGDVQFDYGAFIFLGIALALLRHHASEARGEARGAALGASGRN